MSRRAFTLIELLVIVAIMGTMVSLCVVSIRAGQGAARLKGATRDVMASIRHARSMALVMMQPAVVTYSTESVDDEPCAVVKIEGAKLTSKSSGSDVVQTLSGEPIRRDGGEVPREGSSSSKDVTSKSDGGDGEPAISESSGHTVEDMLFAPIASEVVKGVRIKVTMGDEKLEVEETEEKKANRISVFSNVDFLLGRYKEQKADEAKKAAEEAASTDADDKPKANDDQEPVSVIWEANGRCDPHSVWVYLDGTRPESGLCIKIDRFGAAKILSGEDEQ